MKPKHNAPAFMRRLEQAKAKTRREWVRQIIELGVTAPQLDRSLCLIWRAGWMTKSQRNRMRRLYRQEARLSRV